MRSWRTRREDLSSSRCEGDEMMKSPGIKQAGRAAQPCQVAHIARMRQAGAQMIMMVRDG